MQGQALRAGAVINIGVELVISLSQHETSVCPEPWIRQVGQNRDCAICARSLKSSPIHSTEADMLQIMLSTFALVFMAELGDKTGSFIGSVTSGILYASDCACSVYIPGTDFPVDGPVTIKKLLVPVDGSPGSAAALDEASIILKALPETEITLLHVVDVVDIADAAEKDIWPRPVQEAEALLKRNKEELVKAGIPESRISQKVLAGDPADVIAKEADDGDADIILIGRTVRSAVLEVIVGSVGRAVLGRCAKRTLAVVTPDAG